MKAWVLHKTNDFKFEEVDRPAISYGEVLVKVKACGICGSDVPRIYKTGAHNMPLITGHEFSGEVVDAPEANEDLIGKRVGVFPLIPCGKCDSCIKKHPELCRNYDYIGSRCDGAFAEYVVVPVWNLVPIPDSVSYEAAAMMEPMAVAVHAMKMGIMIGGQELSKNSSIAVCGLGTIGLLLVMFLLDAGYENIYVIGRKNIQKELVINLGVKEDNYCNSSLTNPVEWLSNVTGGVDLYFDCVGSNESIIYGIDALAPMGRAVFVGNPYGDMTLKRDVYWQILRKQLTIVGTWNSTYYGYSIDDDSLKNKGINGDDWSYVLERLGKGIISPELLITHKYPLDELLTGLEIMRDKTEDYCKVMIVGE